MAWNKIDGTVTQVAASNVAANGYVIKFYDVGTTTPQAAATDNTGGTQSTNFLIDAQGYTTLSGNECIIHVESDYKLVLYLNQADADANATGSAVYIVDNISGAAVPAGSIGLTELYSIPATNIIIGGTAGNVDNPLSGDVTMTEGGVVSIGAGKVTAAMMSTDNPASVFFAGSIGGLTLSNGTDADHDIDIAVGTCTDSTSVANMSLPATTIEIDEVIGTGNGGFPVGLTSSTPTLNTWYHVFICSKADGVDPVAVFDSSVTAANARDGSNLGATYTLYRMIGSVLTDASINILAFIQDGDEFIWDVGAQIDTTSGSTAALQALQVPLGISTKAKVSINGGGKSVDDRHWLFTSPLITDTLPSSTAFNMLTDGDGSRTDDEGSYQNTILTNTSSQIRHRNVGGSGSDVQMVIWCEGFIHPR